MTRHRCLPLSSFLIALMLVGCDKKPADVVPDATPPEAVVEAAPTPPAAPAEDGATQDEDLEVKTPDEIAEEAEEHLNMENDPSATAGLEEVDFTGKLLTSDDQIKQAYSGKVLKSASWTDKFGTNAFVITESPRNSKGGGMLVATHLTRAGDGSWETIREFKELISECEFDLILVPQLEQPWALTDLDADGLAEVTFTWRADCRSDVSPSPYKVLMEEHGDKYAIRGVTRIVLTPQDKHGGEHTVGKEFDKAPEAFRKHAQKVWDDTSIMDYNNP